MSFIPTRPPTTYVNTRPVDDVWCSLPTTCKTKLSAFASMLPHFIRYTQRFRRGWRERHINLQSKWSQRGSPRAIYTVYTTILPGSAGATYKFTVKMKSTWSPRAIYTVYTTISPGLAGVTFKFTVKMKPTRNLYGIHNDFCGVGGGLRRGCILKRNRDWDRGRVRVKFLHIERKITSVVHSHPPSHYIRKHAPGWGLVMFPTRRTQNKT